MADLSSREVHSLDRRPLIAAAVLLGIGLGGFVDGIVLHQLLQAHNMLSGEEYYPNYGVPADELAVNLEINMFWDGLFHALTWLMTVAGLALLWRAGQRADVPWSTRTLVGGMLLGWGLFNLVEGIIDHHILHIHHVVERADHIGWDLAFLGGSVVLCLAGWGLIHAGRNDTAVRGELAR
jgi:uncharacterized membrane protein